MSVTLCILPSDPDHPGYDPPPARKLTTRVDDLAKPLSKLPGLRDTRDMGCTLVGYPDTSLVVAYDDGTQTTVFLERNCRTAYADGHIHTWSGLNLIDAFLTLYREQLVKTTDPREVEAPTCAEKLTIAQISFGHRSTAPHDDIGVNRGDGSFLLPNPLVEVTFCRYVLVGDQLELTSRHTQRQGLDRVREILNAATVPRWPPTEASCDISTFDPQRLDVVWAADATGAASEIRVGREPCPAVWTQQQFLPVTPALATLLDARLS